jgi:hypothetical protein
MGQWSAFAACSGLLSIPSYSEETGRSHHLFSGMFQPTKRIEGARDGDESTVVTMSAPALGGEGEKGIDRYHPVVFDSSGKG